MNGTVPENPVKTKENIAKNCTWTPNRQPEDDWRSLQGQPAAVARLPRKILGRRRPNRDVSVTQCTPSGVANEDPPPRGRRSQVGCRLGGVDLRDLSRTRIVSTGITADRCGACQAKTTWKPTITRLTVRIGPGSIFFITISAVPRQALLHPPTSCLSVGGCKGPV